MPETINARLTDALRDDYREILLAEWSDSTLDKVLLLLWAEIDKTNQLEQELCNLFRPDRESTPESGAKFNTGILDRLWQLRNVLTDENIPELPKELSTDGEDPLVLKTETVCCYLIFQHFKHVAGEAGFFADTQSILFQICVNFFLPELETKARNDLRACVANAMYSHTYLVWRNNPAHMYYLQSALMDSLGASEPRIRLLYQSLNLTRIEDHSFLTKVQTFWSELIDVGRYTEAITFLLNVYRYSVKDHLEELAEMFRLTPNNWLLSGSGI